MKKKQAFIIFMVFCLVLASLCFVVSTAWYYSSRKVSDEGMLIKTNVSQNLVITQTLDEMKNVKVEDADRFTATTESSENVFTPVSHKSGETNGALYYLKNTDAVDKTTGLVDSPVLEAVPTTGDEVDRFYIDHTVYIASAGAAMTDYQLTVTLDGESEAENTDSLCAASIDFLAVSGDFASVASATPTYIGTLNVAQLDSAANDYTTEKDSLVIKLPYSPNTGSTKYSGLIPMPTGTGTDYKTAGCIKIVMRCYFDGALLKSKGQAYVNTKTVDVDHDVTLNVSFVAEAIS